MSDEDKFLVVRRVRRGRGQNPGTIVGQLVEGWFRESEGAANYMRHSKDPDLHVYVLVPFEGDGSRKAGA
jgi:hypothetical protein